MPFKVKEFFKNTTFKGLYFLNVQKALRSIKHRENRITVLCLHRVSAEYDYFWDPMKPESFEQLINYLLKYYEIIPIERIHEKPGKLPRVILSFDDGYYDFYSNVLPVLKHYSLPANHNIVTDIVNGKQDVIWTEKLNFLFNYFKQTAVDDVLQLNAVELRIKEQRSLDSFYIVMLKELFKLQQVERQTILDTWFNRYGLKIIPKKMMGWSEIVECAENGVDFGSHTKTHPVLTSVKSEDEMNAELVESKLEIEKNLGRKVWTLAPPNGMCNDDILKHAAASGYKYVLGVGNFSDVYTVGENITFLSRLNLISEPFSHMILRIEELQSNIKKYGGV